MHDIQIMTEVISFPRKSSKKKNTSLNPVISHTTTKKLLLTRMKTKHNALYYKTTL